MHGIFYDPTHDEIVVPVALGGAVLTLPGGANGGDPPIRVLQGPKTGMVQPDTLYVDVAHDEMIVDSGDDSVLVFPRTAAGDVAPIRKIGGPRTQIRNIYGMSVDAVHNLIVVGNRVDTGGRESTDGILIFNRTDNGDVPPRGVIKGPASGLVWPAGVAINPAHHEVYTIDSVSNALFMFNMPEFFFKPPATSSAGKAGQ